jgi:hypothetical protein
MSERRACSLVAADRNMILYRSRRPPDIKLRTRLRERRRSASAVRLPAAVPPSAEQGEPSCISSRIYRLYHKEGLIVRKRKARRSHD